MDELEVKIKSRSSDRVYTVRVTSTGWRCDCAAGRNGRRCWHVEAAQRGGDSPEDAPMGGARRSVTLQLPEILHHEISAASELERKTFADFARDALADAVAERLDGVERPSGRFQQIHVSCIACGAGRGDPCRSYDTGLERAGYHTERRASWQAWRSVFAARSG